MYVLAKLSTSLNLKTLHAIFTEQVRRPPLLVAHRTTSPGWRPSWAWYLAEAPALSAVACNSVPALTLLSGSAPPEPLRRRESRYFVSGRAERTWDKYNVDWVPTLNLAHKNSVERGNIEQTSQRGQS